MKVISKSKELIAIKVERTARFYSQLGRYLEPDSYELIKQPHSWEGYDCYIKIQGQKFQPTNGYYILIDLDSKEAIYISDEVFKNNYIEIKE